MVGVQLLSQLVVEMNQISDSEGNRSLTKHRKIASSFRDTQLFEIFRLACSLLSTANENCKNLNFDDVSQVGCIIICESSKSIICSSLRFFCFFSAWINHPVFEIGT